jgi:hypothetical protein
MSHQRSDAGVSLSRCFIRQATNIIEVNRKELAYREDLLSDQIAKKAPRSAAVLNGRLAEWPRTRSIVCGPTTKRDGPQHQGRKPE